MGNWLLHCTWFANIQMFTINEGILALKVALLDSEVDAQRFR
jgi:hypothetical protein